MSQTAARDSSHTLRAITASQSGSVFRFHAYARIGDQQQRHPACLWNCNWNASAIALCAQLQGTARSTYQRCSSARRYAASLGAWHQLGRTASSGLALRRDTSRQGPLIHGSRGRSQVGRDALILTLELANAETSLGKRLRVHRLRESGHLAIERRRAASRRCRRGLCTPRRSCWPAHSSSRCFARRQGMPLRAGGILISSWRDGHDNCVLMGTVGVR